MGRTPASDRLRSAADVLAVLTEFDLSEGEEGVLESEVRLDQLLRSSGFAVDVSDSLDAYDERLGSYDLVVQCWSDGELTDDQFTCLDAAVRGGTGLAGWHGGLVDAFRHSRGYMQLVGGQFVAHPGDFVDHRVDITNPAPTGSPADLTFAGEVTPDPRYPVLSTTLTGPRFLTRYDGQFRPAQITDDIRFTRSATYRLEFQ